MKVIKYEKKLLLLKFERKAWSDKFEESASPEWIDIDTICKWKGIDRESAEKLPLSTEIRTKSNVVWFVLGESEWRESGEEWVFKENAYQVARNYADDQIRLLVLEEFDKERRYFEKLKTKYDSENLQSSDAYLRPRIPESVRIEVWRRDGGKCARCESREKLEYDHIVPISKGGSNTARNIELLCEKHNRSKSNNLA